MAHAARVSDLSDGLIESISGIRKDHHRHKQVKGAVARGLRDQSHARINQFEIKSRLDGLIEKFGVLDRDDLADSLQARLEELPSGNKWLPEMLALCLALSDRPADKTPADALDRLIEPLPVEETLSWSDIVAEDPLDEPGLWDDVERGYHSSGDEGLFDDADVSEHTVSTKATSVEDDIEAQAAAYVQQPTSEILTLVEATRSGLAVTSTDQTAFQHELTLARESLAMLRGFDTDLYQRDAHSGKISVRVHPRIKNAAPSTVLHALIRFAYMGSELRVLREWTRSPQSQPYLCTLQASSALLLSNFASEVSRLDECHVCQSANTVVSVVNTLSQTESMARHVLGLASLMQRAITSDTTSSFDLLDAIHDHIASAQMAGDDESTQVLGAVLCEATTTYLRTVGEWTRDGKLDSADDAFFVQEADRECSLGATWHKRYTIRRDRSGQPSAPAFMRDLVPRIFALGKTRMFADLLHNTSTDYEAFDGGNVGGPDFGTMLGQLQENPLLPFPQAFNEILHDWLANISTDSTPQLKRSILNDQGLSSTLPTLNAVCLAGNGAQFQLFAETLFERVDHGQSSWANAFLLTELARDAFGSVALAQNITVSLDTSKESTSTIEALQALRVKYHFPWSLQNITREETTSTHTQAFALLLQLSRARYLLRDQLFALRPLVRRPDALLGLRQKLLAYTQLLQAHAATVGRVLSAEVQERIEAAADIDAMVAIYAEHRQRLERSLLLSLNLKPVHDAVVSLLGICEKFKPVLNAAMNADKGGTITETLAAAKALEKEFDGLISFMTAGVRSVSRAGADVLLVTLAEQLEWLNE